MQSIIELPDGNRLYRWVDIYGTEWACGEYDHGAFCRNCVQIEDPLMRNLLDQVFGMLERD